MKHVVAVVRITELQHFGAALDATAETLVGDITPVPVANMELECNQ